MNGIHEVTGSIPVSHSGAFDSATPAPTGSTRSVVPALQTPGCLYVEFFKLRGVSVGPYRGGHAPFAITIPPPDGRWLTYQSDESGQDEIYVRPFPEVASGRWQISTDSGTRPLWVRNGQNLHYVAPPGALMDVRIDHGTTFVAGAPTKLFGGPYDYGDLGEAGRTYDVSPDGQRFLMIKSAEEQATRPTSVVVVLNWFEELRRLVPKR
jgi:hypothetical protein